MLNEFSNGYRLLKEGKEVKIPVQAIKEPIIQNKEVEHKVAKAANNLHKVNT